MPYTSTRVLTLLSLAKKFIVNQLAPRQAGSNSLPAAGTTLLLASLELSRALQMHLPPDHLGAGLTAVQMSRLSASNNDIWKASYLVYDRR